MEVDNRDGRSLGHLQLAQIQMDVPEPEAKFQAFDKILRKLYDYEQVSLKFLLGDKCDSPPTDLLKEALAISGNYYAIQEIFDQTLDDVDLQQLKAQNPYYSAKVNLLRKKLFILAENLNPIQEKEIICRLSKDSLEYCGGQQIEIFFETLIKANELALNNCERLKQVLVDLKLTEFHNIFSMRMDDGYYKINLSNIGMCIIINQKLYKEGSNLNSRLGTDLDCSRLKETFTMLGYEVVVLKDVTSSRMTQKLKEARANIEVDCSSLVVCILAHGQKDTIIGTDGNVIRIDKIKEIFDATNCRALMKKPKIFFIQACQGDEKLAASSVEVPTGLAMESDNGPHTVTTSKSCDKFTDFFTYISSVPGTASFRHCQEGTFFVKTLCSSFLHPSPSMEMELMDVCTRAQRMTTSMKAAIDGKQCAMVPEKRETLDRIVKFHANQEWVRSAAKLRLRRVLGDMCIEGMIKERLKEIM